MAKGKTATRERLINETWSMGRGERKGKSMKKGSSRLEVNAQRVSFSLNLRGKRYEQRVE